MSNAERIEKALNAANMGGIFAVKINPQYSNLVDLTHNKERASKAHEGEDLYKASQVLKAAGFSGCIAGLTLTVRESTAYDIELSDLC